VGKNYEKENLAKGNPAKEKPAKGKLAKGNPAKGLAKGLKKNVDKFYSCILIITSF